MLIYVFLIRFHAALDDKDAGDICNRAPSCSAHFEDLSRTGCGSLGIWDFSKCVSNNLRNLLDQFLAGLLQLAEGSRVR